MARNVEVEIEVNGKNITADISNYVKSVTYNDVMDGEANTAEIELHDVNHIWREAWFPQRGDTAKITFIRKNWSGEGEELLPLDCFEIDEIENSYGSSGNVAKVKLNSIPNNSGLRSTDESQSWEKVNLSKIAADIAEKAGMPLLYDAEDDPLIERAEKSEQSNLAFLKKLCADNYLILLVTNGQLVISNEKKLEEQDAAVTLTYGEDAVKSFRMRTTISKIYRSCEINYKNGKKSEGIKGKFEDPSKEKGLTLKINKKVETAAEAEKLARNELRKKNKAEVKGSISLIGNFAYLSGVTIELAGHGKLDGKYIIERSRHKIGGSGYGVDIEIRKCLGF